MLISSIQLYSWQLMLICYLLLYRQTVSFKKTLKSLQYPWWCKNFTVIGLVIFFSMYFSSLSKLSFIMSLMVLYLNVGSPSLIIRIFYLLSSILPLSGLLIYFLDNFLAYIFYPYIKILISSIILHFQDLFIYSHQVTKYHII